MDPDVLHYMQILNMYKGLMVSVKLGSMDPDVLHYMQILNKYKGLMVSVKLGSMDPDVLHYMQILNRYYIWTDRPIWYIENLLDWWCHKGSCINLKRKSKQRVGCKKRATYRKHPRVALWPKQKLILCSL